MGRAAKFKKGLLTRRKSKSSENSNNPSQQQIINWLSDPELIEWIYRAWDEQIPFDFIAKMLLSLTNKVLNDPGFQDDHMCQAAFNKDYTIGINTLSWTFWVFIVHNNVLNAPDWSKTPFDF